jgi:hypothetical protein
MNQLNGRDGDHEGHFSKVAYGLHAGATPRIVIYGASSTRRHQVISALRGCVATELCEPNMLGKGLLSRDVNCVVLVLDTYSDRATLERALPAVCGHTVPVVAVASSVADDVAPWPPPRLRAAWLSSRASGVEVRQVVERLARHAPLRRIGAAILAAQHLPGLLRRALSLLCLDDKRIESVQILADRVNCNGVRSGTTGSNGGMRPSPHDFRILLIGCSYIGRALWYHQPGVGQRQPSAEPEPTKIRLRG